MSKAMQFKARMKNLANQNHISAQAVLQIFMMERLLERISGSTYRDVFILKGGMLIAALVGIESRTTMDMDTTLRDYPLSQEMIGKALREICALPLEDEVTFSLDHIVPIREDDEYGGLRASILALYETIKTPLKIDITTGDKITPGAILYPFRSSFEDKTIEVWAYTTETILAEKVETILRRSVFNTRPRDFYDVYILMKCQGETVDNKVFMQALHATAEKRLSMQTIENGIQILQEIQADPVMRQRWDRYCREYHFARDIQFDDVIEIVRGMIHE
jgi:predicted nucleotidyltransferase component of viral defense system